MKPTSLHPLAMVGLGLLPGGGIVHTGWVLRDSGTDSSTVNEHAGVMRSTPLVIPSRIRHPNCEASK